MDEAEEQDAAATDDGGDADAGAAAAGDYPVEILWRPLVLPKGVWEAGLDLNLNNDASVIGTALSFSYGVMDKLQVGASYAFGLKDFEAKGILGLHAGYSVMGEGSLQVRANAVLAYNLLFEDIGPINAGATVRYMLGDKMAVLANPMLVVYNGFDFLDVSIRPIFVSVPVGFAYQATSNIYAEVNTNVAIIEISDADTGFIFADFLPVNVAVAYSLSNMIDVGVTLSADFLADSIGDSMAFGLMARYRGGL